MVTRLLDCEEKGTHNLRTPDGEQGLSTISEPGLYKAILRSRKPATKRFDRWLRHEVLPALRKTGRYGSSAPDLAQMKAERKIALSRLFSRLSMSRSTSALRFSKYTATSRLFA